MASATILVILLIAMISSAAFGTIGVGGSSNLPHSAKTSAWQCGSGAFRPISGGSVPLNEWVCGNLNDAVRGCDVPGAGPGMRSHAVPRRGG
jgi:hypothetical protein